jgi:hypothetical protein
MCYYRLRVFENRLLREIFGPKRDEVTVQWGKLHSGELQNLYSSQDIIRQIKSRRMRWAGHVARMGDERNMYQVWWESLEGKRPLGRPRRRWQCGINMDLMEIGCGDVEWIQLAQHRGRWLALINAVLNYTLVFLMSKCISNLFQNQVLRTPHMQKTFFF